MWVEIISAVFPGAQFAPPATRELVAEVERGLGQSIPPDLRDLLMESNGVETPYVHVVWSAERILADNRSFRADEGLAELYEPFNGLLFFGDNGGGDQFAFAADDSTSGVLVWEHDDDTRRVVAENLVDYLRRRLTSDGDEWYIDYGTD